MEKGSHAVMGTGRRSWIEGSTRVDASRFQPIMSPRGIPTPAAMRKPSNTRRDEESTLASQVPEEGERLLPGGPTIHVDQDAAACAGAGRVPGANHCQVTAG